MDLDSVVDMVQAGDCFVAQNCRVGKDSQGRRGAVKPVAGTTLRHVDSAAGTKLTIGSITDEVKSRIYRFNQNSLGTHKIIAFDRKTNTAFTVLQESNVTGGLGFSANFPIHSAALIGDYLYFTDNLNNPRRINVERGIKTNHSSYTSPDGTVPVAYDTPLAQWDISDARRVPTYPLKVRKLWSVDEADIPDRPKGENRTAYKSFQFTYRYVYSTSEYSTVTAYSQMVPPTASFYRPGASEPNGVFDYDTIRVELSKHEPIGAEVDKIEILVRQSNIGPWSIIKTFDRRLDEALFNGHNTYGDADGLGFYFFNDIAGIPVADVEAYLPFSDNPLLANSIEIAQNRLFYGNVLKGYDYWSESALAVSIEPLDYIGPVPPAFWMIWGTYYLIEWTGGSLPEVVVLYVSDAFGPAAGWYETPYTSVQFNSGSLDMNPFGPFVRYPIIDSEVPPLELIQFLNPTSQVFTVTEYILGGQVVFLPNMDRFVNVAKTFKDGITYKIQVTFYDFSHRNAGITHTPIEIKTVQPSYAQLSHVRNIRWSLTQNPGFIPIWAHSYEISRSIADEPFIDGYTDNVDYGQREEDGTYTFPAPIFQHVIGIDISVLLGLGLGYTFSDGDVVFLADETGANTYSLRIIGTQGDRIIVEWTDIGDPIGVKFYFEIKTPNNSEETHFEVGRGYRINNPGTATRSFSQTSGTLHGDTYFGEQVFDSQRRLVQRMNPNSKVWQNWPQDYGRPTPLIYSKQRRYETDIPWTGTYFPGTETNQLNMALSGDTRTIDSAIGAIQILRLMSRTQGQGTIMLAIGQIESVSIYIGRKEFFDTGSNPSVISTEDVIGSWNVLLGGNGTMNPESFSENNGNGYWFSAISSAWVRYSKAGVEPISDYKFSVFAAWLANLVLTNVNDVPGISAIKLPGGFDDFHKEYVCTIPSIGTWPVVYQVMDVEEDVTMNKTSYSNPTAPLVIGEIYKFRFSSSASVTVNITVTDLFFGVKTFTRTGAATHEFQFVAHATGTYTIAIVTTPPLNTIVNDYSLTKQRINPYVGIDNYPKTVVFDEENNRWGHFKNMVPEWWGRVGHKLLSFKAGTQYSVDSATVGSFHGVPYAAWISFPSNTPPNSVKRYQALSMETDVAPSFAHLRTEEPNVQSTDLLAIHFTNKEGVVSAAWRRDRLSPNTPGTVIDKWARGDEVRGRYGKVLVEWPKLTRFVLRFVNIIFRDSPGSKL